jgi:hypothetical protein
MWIGGGEVINHSVEAQHIGIVVRGVEHFVDATIVVYILVSASIIKGRLLKAQITHPT